MAVNKVVYNTEDGEQTLIDLTEDTVTPETLVEGTTAHCKDGSLITGTVPTVGQATPTIAISSSGLITASATQSRGLVPAGTKSATKQLSVQAAKTITPGTTSQTAVTRGKYTTGAITVAGDANLTPENIAEGVSIFGVTGTHSGGGGGGSISTITYGTFDTLVDDGFYEPGANMYILSGGGFDATNARIVAIVYDKPLFANPLGDLVCFFYRDDTASDFQRAGGLAVHNSPEFITQGYCAVDQYSVTLIGAITDLSKIHFITASESAATITFTYSDGDGEHTLTAEAGMTWAEFVASDYNPKATCECCGDSRYMFVLEEELTGDSGDKIGCYSGSTCPQCHWDNSGDCPWVCYDDEETGDTGFLVGYDTVIQSGKYYYGGNP